MGIFVEHDPMGMGGCAWHLSAPTQLSVLPEQAAALVDDRTASIFADVPAALGRMAEAAPLPGMRRWLESLQGARCVLEVYATEHAGSGARLRFHFSERWAPSFRATPAAPRVPCPALLKRVHEVAGAVDTQFGCSGTLVPLDALPTLRELVAEVRVNGFEELAASLQRDSSLADLVGVLEVDGDWLCTNLDGEACWFGGEWVDGGQRPAWQPLSTALDGYFAALAERRFYRPETSHPGL